MLQVINNRADYADLAAAGAVPHDQMPGLAGPAYVERIHSGRMSAQVLAPFLGM